MQRGKLIIPWVGGILSSLVLMAAVTNAPDVQSQVDLAVRGGPTVGGHIIETIFLLLAIWILCGLVWGWLYRGKV